MSKYTTELRFICERYAELEHSEGYNSINDIINASWDKVFDFDFPIFDETYRKTLCTRIIKHFYTREICAETVGRWKLFMDSKLNLIMDKYNLMYKAYVHDINPLYDVDYTRTYKKDNTGKQTNDGETKVSTNDSNTDNSVTQSTGVGDSAGNTTSSFSDTPQGSLAGVESGTYITNATYGTTNGTSHSGSTTEAESSSTGTSTEEGTSKNTIDVNNIEEYTERITGKQGSVTYGTMIRDFINDMHDVDDMIIHELEPMFMGIY